VTNLAAPDDAIREDAASAFERYRTELTGYCYRMLGSVFEADDAVQETLVRAWRGQGRFEGRSSLRSWLYRIATNVCLDMVGSRRRRALPMDLGPAATGAVGFELPEATWLQPAPDHRVIAAGADPADVAVARSTVRLAFVAALQHLPPRQRAVLILRDVLGWPATEVAALLDTSGTAVHSTLARARVTLAASGVGPDARGAALDHEHLELLDRYVDAFERYDVDALVALLHEDATLSMPPMPYWITGRSAIEGWWRGDGSACRGSRLIATAANGAPAFGHYHPSPSGGHEPFGILLLETSEGRITVIHTFIDARLFPLFGLPAEINC
jgi:RNA polymerase sigma-70 factor (ECF subfamily)